MGVIVQFNAGLRDGDKKLENPSHSTLNGGQIVIFPGVRYAQHTIEPGAKLDDAKPRSEH